ncbi:MAG: dihydroorotate dehydrogenase electron transfer subunit [Acidobacteriota bacterium]
MIDTIATVESNLELTPGYKLLTLNFKEAIAAKAGQFAMLKAHDTFEPLLRRALAIYRIENSNQLSFLYQVLGRGTQMLSHLDSGGKVDILLPLGNCWLDEPLQKTGLGSKALVVAGGIGSASVYLLCQELQRRQIETQIFFGAANRKVATGCGLDDFKKLALPITLTTDDGSLGERGFVTAPLEKFLREGKGENATIYTCGPWVMMKRVAEIAEGFAIKCLASLEAPMGCGFGVCVGCVVAIKDADAKSYQAYQRVCTDGSIFPAEIIRWEVTAMAH